MKIACVGAGPAGLYFAILMKLRDPRHEITVYERNPEGVTHGWGVVFWDDLVADLRANDPVTAQAILDRSFGWIDQVVDVKGSRPARGGGTGFGICRRTLLAILRERATDLGVEILFEHEIAEGAQLPDADVIVAADGVGSQVRRLRMDRFRTRIDLGRNKYVWLGTPRVFEAFTFGLVPTQAGWIWFHAYGYSKDMSTFIVECSPETWKGLGFDRRNSAQSLTLLENLFEDHLNGHRLLSHSDSQESLPWLNFRNMTNEKWHADNIALLGDAAHTTHFSIGSGTRLAIQDAIALAANLHGHEDVQTALAAYEQERQLAMLRPQREARLSAAWFENIPRYAHLAPPQLFALLLDRRSRLVSHIPPKLYYRLHWAKRIPPVRMLYRWAALGVEQLAGLHRRLSHS
ncbi:FAD-dependent monooxygenase [Microvirga lenta]|uniref:FAD-dependent monooxygenase n=1 Tax=Microvirga lenta TaxID=2881337 RepID=UPI001CFF5E11|nr:FAD-dependent monooxygenase [Microvirga lenta]MCB5175397.1 FAD-dependent monooxygenase [Microvirga lenta]